MTSPVAATIGPAGISAPTFADILAYLKTTYQGIFGADVYLGNDSQDGQWIAALAQAFADCNAATVAAYNAFSPATAQGAGLSSVVKINGLRRLVATASTCTVSVGGVAGTVIANGQAVDVNGNVWALPATVTIPGGGTIDVLATAVVLGAINAAPSTITGIQTPSFGWQTVTNSGAATAGQPVESDAALRVRQAQSVELPSQTIFDGIWSLIETVPNVTRVRGYENNTSSPDVNGVPAYSLAFIVEGGAALAIETAIASKIPPGIPTYGSTSGTITDSFGSTRVIDFSVATPAVIHLAITVKQLAGYSAVVGVAIQNAIQAYIDGLPIGVNVSYTAMFLAAYQALQQYPGTYGINSLTLAKNSGGAAAADVTINWNEAPTNIIANTVLTLV
jgi:uncharacterized phage protein gp47/JayE